MDEVMVFALSSGIVEKIRDETGLLETIDKRKIRITNSQQFFREQER